MDTPCMQFGSTCGPPPPKPHILTCQLFRHSQAHTCTAASHTPPRTLHKHTLPPALFHTIHTPNCHTQYPHTHMYLKFLHVLHTCIPSNKDLSASHSRHFTINGYHTSSSHTSTVPDTPHTLPSPLHTHTHRARMYTITCLISFHDHLAQALTPATPLPELILQASSYHPNIPRQETPPNPCQNSKPTSWINHEGDPDSKGWESWTEPPWGHSSIPGGQASLGHRDEVGQGRDGQALLAQQFWVLQTQPRAPRVALAAHLLPLSPAPHLPNEDTLPASRSSSHACLERASLGPVALAQGQLVLGSGSPRLAGRYQKAGGSGPRGAGAGSKESREVRTPSYTLHRCSQDSQASPS